MNIKHLTLAEQKQKERTSRRSNNKNGGGMIEVMRKRIREWKKVGILPDKNTKSNQFKEELIIMRNNRR